MTDLSHSSSQELRLEIQRALNSWGIGQWSWRFGDECVDQDPDLRRLFEWPLDAPSMPFAHFMTLVHPNDRSLIAEGIRIANETGNYPDQIFRVVLPSQRTRWMLAKGQTIRDESGKLVQLYGTSIDVTQIKQNESARERAQKLEAMGQLAAGVAHDFNNLLVAMLGNVDLAKETTDPAELRELLDEATHAANRARELTQQLLAFGRRQPLKQRRVNINEMLTDTLRLLRRLLPENIRLHVEMCRADPSVLGDAGQLEQVVVNLCVNARDAMPQGGTLSIVCRCEPLLAGEAHTEVQIKISDDGVGIPEEDLPRVFDPFFTTKTGGTGLGLSTAYGVMSQHGGSVSVASPADGRQQGGCTFTLCLPAELSESITAPSLVPPHDLALRGQGETILVAEDEIPVRNIVCRILRRAGYHVVEARDGREAVDRFREHQTSIALVLLDAVMPFRSGSDALAEMRKLVPHVPAVLSSGYSAVLATTKDLAPDAEFLNKPYEPDDLLRTIRSQLDAVRLES